MTDDYDTDAAELAAHDRFARRYQQNLGAAPDCRDPDHPGCEHCMGEDEDEDD